MFLFQKACTKNPTDLADVQSSSGWGDDLAACITCGNQFSTYCKRDAQLRGSIQIGRHPEVHSNQSQTKPEKQIQIKMK